MVARWFVAQCQPRMELWAIKNAAAQEFDVYWPRYEVKQKRGIGRSYQKGVFPGYIFVSFDVADGYWRSIFSTFGIRRVLGATDFGASALPSGFVETMMEAAPTGIIELPKEDTVQYSIGDQLKITEGPMAGKVGIFKYSEKGRVALLLSLLGRENIVYLPADRVTYAGAPL